MKKILSGISGLRGLAALTVIYYHLNQLRPTAGLSQLSWDFYQFTEHLVFVVSFFFMTSGLFASLPYWRVILFHESIPAFLPSVLRRFARITPAYYLALFISFIFVIIWQGVGVSDFVRLFAGMSFLSWISPQTFFPVEINGPLWFISYEMMGWIMISGFMWIGVRMIDTYLPRNRGIWIASCLAMIAVIFLSLHFAWISLPWTRGDGIVGEWFPTYNPFLFGLHFLLGAVAGGVITYYSDKKSYRINDIATIILSFLLFRFLWKIRGAEDWDYSWPHGPYHFPVVPLLVVAILILLPFTRYLGRLFDNRFFLFASILSYSLYLFHMLVIAGLRRYFFINEQLSNHNWIILSILTFLFSFLLSWFVWKYVENRGGDKKIS